MFKTVGIISSVLILSACGGGGSDGVSNAPVEQTIPSGIYRGTVTPIGDNPHIAAGVITSDGKVAVLDFTTSEAFIGRTSGDKMTGTIYSVTTVPASADVSSISNNSISGTYNSSIAKGNFALVSDPNLYARPSKIESLSGVWVDSVYTNRSGETTWVIQSNGYFSVSSTSGCAATGRFTTIDPMYNEYDVSISITSCPGVNGVYEGFAVVGDTYNTGDTISVIFSNGSVGGFFSPIKQ